MYYFYNQINLNVIVNKFYLHSTVSNSSQKKKYSIQLNSKIPNKFIYFKKHEEKKNIEDMLYVIGCPMYASSKN